MKPRLDALGEKIPGVTRRHHNGKKLPYESSQQRSDDDYDNEINNIFAHNFRNLLMQWIVVSE
jgi:hypothetical protein